MQVIDERCADLAVHKRTVVVGVLVTARDGSAHREVQPVGTITADLLALSDWLRARALRHVAMESTGGLHVPHDVANGKRCRLKRAEKAWD